MTPTCHHGNARARQRAFTLTELIVAIGIFVVLMTIIGGVFALSGRATSQASAVMNVHRQLRLVRETLRQDFAGLDPTRSCLAVVAKLQTTYETPNDRANGITSDHRCDMLMFFTDTPQRPFVDPADRSLPGEAPVQIVYGHANIAEIDPSVPPPANPAYLTPTRLVESNVMNASEWHLARRVVFFDNIDEAASLFWTNSARFLAPQVLEAEVDRTPVSFAYDKWVASTGLFNTTPPFNNMRLGVIHPSYFYTLPNSRTLLDPDPPADRGAQLAYHLLPGVADFKVEYTYDDPSDATAIEPTRWLDPYIVMAAPPPGFGVQRMEWQSGNPDEVVLAGGETPWLLTNYGSEPGFPTVPLIKPRTWPRAIRITMRVYDPRGVLGELAEGGRVVDLQNANGSDRAAQYSPIDFVYIHTF